MPTKVPLFISFDYDHDSFLKEALVEQARNDDSPFYIEDWSVKIASPDWKVKAKARISRSKQIAVICGKHTNTATGVTAEIGLAREVGTPYFLLGGYKDGGNVKPAGALSSDKIYNWTWENLKILIGGGR